MTNLKLIVGLGNPGSEYAQTRHNAGVWYIDGLCRRYQTQLKSESKFFGLTGKVLIAQQEIKLLVPTTFMNLSGKAVQAMASFYQIKPEEILVVHDELDLNPGLAKFKLGGGHGGHNGLKDIINKLGNNRDFYRLRIGIGHPGDKNKVANFVLNRPSSVEMDLIEKIIDESLICTEVWLKQSFELAMNQLHSVKLA